jgi:uncharacterized protein with beta-barrel porin domain
MSRVNRRIPAAWHLEWIVWRSPCSIPTASIWRSGLPRCRKFWSTDRPRAGNRSCHEAPEFGTPLTQLTGEVATGAQRAAFQSTNEFLSLLVHPFGANRGGGETVEAARPADPLLLRAPAALAAAEPRPNVWGASYGSTTATDGDPQGLGSHNLTVHTSGFATGIDDRIGPYTTVGFAIAGGATSWSLSAGLGGGRSDVFQAGIYGSQ